MSRGSAGGRRVDRARLRWALRGILTECDRLGAEEGARIRKLASDALASAPRPAPQVRYPRDYPFGPPETPPSPEELERQRAQRERIDAILTSSRERRDAAFPGYRVSTEAGVPSTYDQPSGGARIGGPLDRGPLFAQEMARPFKRTTVIERAPDPEWCDQCKASPCHEIALARRGQ